MRTNCFYFKHGARTDIRSCLQAPVLISQERFVKQSAVTKSHVLLVRPWDSQHIWDKHHVSASDLGALCCTSTWCKSSLVLYGCCLGR